MESMTEPRKPEPAMIHAVPKPCPKTPMERIATRRDAENPPKKPRAVTPPLIPLGTLVNVMMDTGSLWLNTPKEPLQVSAAASALAAEKAAMEARDRDGTLIRSMDSAAGSPLASTCTISLLFPFFSLLFTNFDNLETKEEETLSDSVMISEQKEETEPSKIEVTEEQSDDDSAVYKDNGELVIDPYVERVLDEKEFSKKIEFFEMLRGKCSEDMLTTIAISLDIQLQEGSIEDKYSQILRTLKMHEKYETSRLRG